MSINTLPDSVPPSQAWGEKVEVSSSPTIEFIEPQYQKKIAETNWPYKKNAYKIELCMLRCCGTKGYGMKGATEKDCCTRMKKKCIKCTPKCLSGLGSCLLTISTLGAYACLCEYPGYQADQKKVTPIVPGS